VTTPKNLFKLLIRYVPLEKESSLLTSHLVLFKKSSRELDWKIPLKTEDDTETCFSPLRTSKNTFQALSSIKKPPNNPMTMESILFSMWPHLELFPASRSIKDLA
jgi:hypothetical protein